MIRKAFIYALINPINNHVFCIGATINPTKRLAEHIGEIRYRTSFKCDQIISILDSELKVEMEILEECDSDKISFWEEFYIDLFLSFGFELKQSRTSSYSNIFFNKETLIPRKGISVNSDLYEAIVIIARKKGVGKRLIVQDALRNYIKNIIYNDDEYKYKSALFEKFHIEE